MNGANARATIEAATRRPARDPDATLFTHRQWRHAESVLPDGADFRLFGRLVALGSRLMRARVDLGEDDELLARQCGVSVEHWRGQATDLLPVARWVLQDRKLAIEQQREGGRKGGFARAARFHADRARAGVGEPRDESRKCMGAIENQRAAALAKWAVDCQRARFHGEPEPPHPDPPAAIPEQSAVKWVTARLKGAAVQMGRPDAATKVAQAVVDLLVRASMCDRHGVEYRDIEAALLLQRAAFVDEWAPARWDTSPGG